MQTKTIFIFIILFIFNSSVFSQGQTIGKTKTPYASSVHAIAVSLSILITCK